MEQKTYAVIGGGSGMGLALTQILVERGDRVLIGGRSQDRLARARDSLGSNVLACPVDTGDHASLQAFFEQAPPLSGLFTPGAAYVTGSFADATPEVAESAFRSKFWGQYWAVRAALLRLLPEAGVVLMSGAASVRPLGHPAYAACNAAVEGLTRALAQELSPIRVNCLSPGTVDSDLWRRRPAEVREPAYEAFSRLSLVGRPGAVEDLAQAALFLLDNRNMTGATLFSDGGYSLR
ncbi:SDR family oxidoreductase [Brevundimonas faecalis]|uniref:NAD(P)-dependent dehydrogenase (Short-subunit alcohol dehydrogenase family) n=1 Tax=Brevundimonas faecalis TaxID=947378 RepID=A0ABV2RCH4_9CAUL